MQSIDQALNEVEKLQQDLEAAIVVGGGPEHYELGRTPGRGNGTSNIWTYEHRHIKAAPVQTVPDHNARATARKNLSMIYETSAWYSARYAAGQAIGCDAEKLSQQAEAWIAVLSPEALLKTVDVKFVGYMQAPVISAEMGPVMGIDTDSIAVYDSTPLNGNLARAKRAVSDLGALCRISHLPQAQLIMQQVYDSSDDKDLRRSAGRDLGYSSAKIAMHELFR